MNYYQLLNISDKANSDEIKKAYRKMIQQYHPDHNKSPNAEKITIQLNHAKEILLNETKRKEYDAFLREQERIERESKRKAHYHQHNKESNANQAYHRSDDKKSATVTFSHFYQYYFIWLKLSSKSTLLKCLLSFIGLIVKLSCLIFRLTVALIYLIIAFLEGLINLYTGIMSLLALLLVCSLIYAGFDGAAHEFGNSNVLIWVLKSIFYILFFSIPVILYYSSVWLCEVMLISSYKLENVLFKYIFKF